MAKQAMKANVSQGVCRVIHSKLKRINGHVLCRFHARESRSAMRAWRCWPPRSAIKWRIETCPLIASRQTARTANRPYDCIWLERLEDDLEPQHSM